MTHPHSENITKTALAAVCNQKGGVGKTTLTINLGAALSRMGLKTLLIDLDPQGHLTEGVGLHDLYEIESPSLYEQLVDNFREPAKLIRQLESEEFQVIPSNYQMMLAEQSLYMTRNREHKLRNLLAPLDGTFDWILIDCPPTLGNLTDNALSAARQVIVPVQAESTSIRALELLFDQIESIEQGLGISIRTLAIVPNLVQQSTIARNTLRELRDQLPQVTPFELRKRVVLQNAWDEGRSIFSYQPQTPDQAHSQHSIEEDYLRLAKFVLEQAKRKP